MVRTFAASLALLSGLSILGTGAHAQTTAQFKVLYAFPSGKAGAFPEASLLHVGTKLYGTTSGGGAANPNHAYGTVFSLNPTTGAMKVIYAFQGGGDGRIPSADLIMVGGVLYGTTAFGGSNSFNGGGGGTVFSLDPKTGVHKVVYAFAGHSDGATPLAGLVAVGSLLYGTTEQGGGGNCGSGNGCGTAFSLDPVTGQEHTLHTFLGGSDGQYPEADFVNVNGFLYGTTLYGGNTALRDGLGGGTVFSMDPTSGAYRTIYAFQGVSTSDLPSGPLVTIGGKLYGAVMGYPAKTKPKIFSLDPASGAERTLYTFDGVGDGVQPDGLVAIGNILYGTTAAGGSRNGGTVFSLDITSKVETILHSFPGDTTPASLDGAYPDAKVIAVDGTLYGTTFEGGINNNPCHSEQGCGTIFSITP